MSNYPSGTDMSYFDDPIVERHNYKKGEIEEHACWDCGETIEITPDGANRVGGDEGEIEWWAFEVECPDCHVISDYGNCD